jgi:signal transduction histidine kinase
VLNLVSNAIYACNEKDSGKVSIQTSIDKEENLHINVTDNGIGISKENLKYIFDVFFSTKGSKGTGLGLAVTKKIINEHLGKIEVESDVGKGSKFSITLPRRKSSECSKSEATKSERSLD